MVEVKTIFIVFLNYPFNPVSILTRIHNKMTPRVTGITKNIEVIENLFFSKSFKIKLVTPRENKTEKKYE